MMAQNQKRPVPILMYHSISNFASPRFRRYTVAPGLFRDQMSYLSSHGYSPISISQFVNGIVVGTGLPNRPVVLTFDDGFTDFYTDVLPTLIEFGFKATLYVTTAFMGETSRWLQDEGEGLRPILSWRQLIEICNQGIECGAHSHTHPQLDRLPHPVAREEIILCKQLLEEHLQQEVPSFAYPYGYYSTAVRRFVREAGFTSACAVGHTSSSTTGDRFALRRLMVTADTDADRFVELLTHHYTLLERGVRRIREMGANTLRMHKFTSGLIS